MPQLQHPLALVLLFAHRVPHSPLPPAGMLGRSILTHSTAIRLHLQPGQGIQDRHSLCHSVQARAIQGASLTLHCASTRCSHCCSCSCCSDIYMYVRHSRKQYAVLQEMRWPCHGRGCTLKPTWDSCEAHCTGSDTRFNRGFSVQTITPRNVHIYHTRLPLVLHVVPDRQHRSQRIGSTCEMTR